MEIREVPLSEIAEINRGASITPASIKERTVLENTGIQYVSVKDIQDNYIQKDLPFLSDIEPRELRYLLKDNDLLLAKMGLPKFAFVRNVGEKKIIPLQNFYILRFKEDIHPLYIKAFFESKTGYQRLENAYIKSTIPTLPVRELEKLLIPLPYEGNETLPLQQYFVERYEYEEAREAEFFRQYDEQRQKRLGLFDEVIAK